MVGWVLFIAIIILTPQALKRLRQIYQWYFDNVSPEAARRKRDKILDEVGGLDQFADKYPVYKGRRRYKPIDGINIVYRKDKDVNIRITDFAPPHKKPKK